MRDAEEIMLLTDDPVALTDVPALAQANGWAMELRQDDGSARFHLKRM